MGNEKILEAKEAVEEAAKALAVAGSSDVSVSESRFPLAYETFDQAAPPTNRSSERFSDIIDELNSEDGIIDPHDIRKRNLAVALEGLQRAIDLYTVGGFPMPDAAGAVKQLTDAVSTQVRSLEKSVDPRVQFDRIVVEVFHGLFEEVVKSLGEEMKWLRQECTTSKIVADDKQKIFDDTLKTALARVGPALQGGLEVSKRRLQKILGIKEKADNFHPVSSKDGIPK